VTALGIRGAWQQRKGRKQEERDGSVAWDRPNKLSACARKMSKHFSTFCGSAQRTERYTYTG
jgi:hypothetical protein